MSTLGNPLFKTGDRVCFKCEGAILTGRVFIIDAWGTFMYPDDVCYDVMVDNYREQGKCLFKHLKETSLKRVVSE